MTHADLGKRLSAKGFQPFALEDASLRRMLDELFAAHGRDSWGERPGIRAIVVYNQHETPILLYKLRQSRNDHPFNLDELGLGKLNMDSETDRWKLVDLVDTLSRHYRVVAAAVIPTSEPAHSPKYLVYYSPVQIQS